MFVRVEKALGVLNETEMYTLNMPYCTIVHIKTYKIKLMLIVFIDFLLEVAIK